MEKDSEILATAPQPIQGRRRLAWRGWALAALLGTSVLVAGFWMLRRHDGRQTAMAQQFAKQASAFMMQKKWAEAKPLLIKAFKADSADPLVLRTCAFYEREAVNNLECAGYYLTQLERTGKATDTDHAMFGQSLAVTGLVAEARSIFNNLPMAARGSKEAIELEALLAMHDGDSARATSLMRRALAQDPDSESSQLKLALLDLNCIFPEIQCQAATSLMKIARDGGSLSTSAALHLASHPALQKNEAEELMQIAPHLPEGGDAVRLAALHACICFSPKARESLLDRETQNADALSPEQLAGLCRWLNNEGEHQRVLQLLNRERAEKFPVLFSPFIDALLRDQKWGEITAMLDNAKNLPLNTLNMVQLRARCAYGTGAPFNVVHDLLEQARRLATASKLAVHRL